MTLTLQRETTEFIYVGLSGDVVSGVAEAAFMNAAERPEEGDWKEATKVSNDGHDLWNDAVSSGVDGDWYIAVLIGTFGEDGLELSSGDYMVWVRLTDDTERPVRIAPITLVIA